MSQFLLTLENEAQIAALAFLGLVYVLRIIWLLRFNSKKERTFPAGSARAGIALSMMNVAMPWAMESTRKNTSFYAQFVIFHLGVVAAISATFIIPYWPELFELKAVVVIFQLFVAASFIVGILRLIRRLRNPAIRLISSPDDYFSLIMMILFFASAFLAMPNKPETGEWPLVIFFALTALLLIYVPFSKIGHYLYYPFTRFFLGRVMGHRGVYPGKKHSRQKGAD